MADSRFKPIGGMFQGVRGSTSVGGNKIYKGQLVKLDARGLIDSSCLDAEFTDIAEKLAGLIEEVNTIKIADIQDLNSRMSDVENSIQQETDNRNNAIAELGAELRAKNESQDVIITESKARIDTLESEALRFQENISQNARDIESLKSLTLGHTSEINSLSSKLTTVVDTYIPGISTNVDTLSNNLQLLSAETTRLSSDLTLYHDDLNKYITQLTELKSNYDTTTSNNNATFETINQRLTALEARVNDILDRLVKCDTAV
jgi:chromosome segregation ATPase